MGRFRGRFNTGWKTVPYHSVTWPGMKDLFCMACMKAERKFTNLNLPWWMGAFPSFFVSSLLTTSFTSCLVNLWHFLRQVTNSRWLLWWCGVGASWLRYTVVYSPVDTLSLSSSSSSVKASSLLFSGTEPNAWCALLDADVVRRLWWCGVGMLGSTILLPEHKSINQWSRYNSI